MKQTLIREYFEKNNGILNILPPMRTIWRAPLPTRGNCPALRWVC